jgi:hypothetical protein
VTTRTWRDTASRTGSRTCTSCGCSRLPQHTPHVQRRRHRSKHGTRAEATHRETEGAEGWTRYVLTVTTVRERKWRRESTRDTTTTAAPFFWMGAPQPPLFLGHTFVFSFTHFSYRSPAAAFSLRHSWYCSHVESACHSTCHAHAQQRDEFPYSSATVRPDTVSNSLSPLMPQLQGSAPAHITPRRIAHTHKPHTHTPHAPGTPRST